MDADAIARAYQQNDEVQAGGLRVGDIYTQLYFGTSVLIELHQIHDIVLTSKEYGASFVDGCGCNVEDRLCACGSNTTRL
jgi:hypothetical protein